MLTPPWILVSETRIMKYLLLFAFVLTISDLVLAADWMHPQYSFRCRESRGIDVFGIHDDSIVTILNGTCKDNTTSPKEGIINISYECTYATEEGKETAYEVFISVKDPVFGETTSTPSHSNSSEIGNVTEAEKTTEAVIIGGHKEHKFAIRCLSIPSGGINKTVAHVFQGGPHKLPDNQKEVFPVEMHFKATKNIDAPDISEIYIGDEFFMFLKYTGASQYAVIPKSCTAYAGTVVPEHGKPDNKKHVSLWDEKQNSQNCTLQKELLATITKYNSSKSIIAAKMYGFRFEGDEYITIACEVGVFPKKTDPGICQNPSRRKRDTGITKRDVVETAIQRKNINGKLRILDYPSEYGNSANATGGTFKWIMLSLGIMISSLLCSLYK